MRRLIRALQRRAPYQLLYVRALATVMRVRVLLTIASFKKVAAIRPGKRLTRRFSTGDIASTVVHAARWVPGATCLTQAAAAQYLLALYGRASQIRVGVKSEAMNRFSAHAWLLCDDVIVLGGDERTLSQYSVLTDLPSSIP